MQSRLGLSAGAALAALALGACGNDNDNKTSSTPAKAPPVAKKVGAPGAKVKFVTPKDGSTESSTVKAKVKLTGFELAPNAVGKPAQQGQGHLHFSMDEGKYDQPKYSGANGKLAVKLGVNGKYSPSVTPTITYTGLPAGKHKLEVYVANNDHTNTGVEGETEFTVQ
jgi:hypothetical protein